MTGARSDALLGHDTVVPEPATVTLTVPAAAWLYGALLERHCLRGQPRDPELRRQVEALRRALVTVLPEEAVDMEADAVHALARGDRRVA